LELGLFFAHSSPAGESFERRGDRRTLDETRLGPVGHHSEALLAAEFSVGVEGVLEGSFRGCEAGFVGELSALAEREDGPPTLAVALGDHTVSDVHGTVVPGETRHDEEG
jgi:hypothetical protein